MLPMQANAVSDKVLDLRKCDYQGANLNGKQLPGALMSESNFSGAQMVEATMTKVSLGSVDCPVTAYPGPTMGLHDVCMCGAVLRQGSQLQR